MGNGNSVKRGDFDYDAMINDLAESFLKARGDRVGYHGVFLYGGRDGVWRRVKRDLVSCIDERGFFVSATYRKNQKDFNFMREKYYPIDLNSFFC